MFKKMFLSICLMGLLQSQAFAQSYVYSTGTTQAAYQSNNVTVSAGLRISTNPTGRVGTVINRIELYPYNPPTSWTNRAGLLIGYFKCTSDPAKPVAVVWSYSPNVGNWAVVKCVPLHTLVNVNITRAVGSGGLATYTFSFVDGSPNIVKTVSNPYGSSMPAKCTSAHEVRWSGPLTPYPYPVLVSTVNKNCTINTGVTLYKLPNPNVYGYQWSDTIVNYTSQYYGF